MIGKEEWRAKVRRIKNIQWDYVIEVAETRAKEDPKEHERTLFIMNCLFSMYLRISELVKDERSNPVMSDFEKDDQGNWWFYVTGKGNKDRKITVCDEMLDALVRYRTYLGLSKFPGIGEETPLIISHTSKEPISNTRQIRRIVQKFF